MPVSWTGALVTAVRPKQWIKNLLLFAGMVFTLNEKWTLGSPTMWDFLERTAAAFGLFSLVASGIYLVNDFLDVEKDRQHPKKRFRPIAAGDLVVVRVDVVLAAHAALRCSRYRRMAPTPPASASSVGSSMKITRASVWRALATTSSATAAPSAPSS